MEIKTERFILGYRFLPEYRGKVYATETAKAILEYGFKELNLNMIYADMHHKNAASCNLMNKLGLLKQANSLSLAGPASGTKNDMKIISEDFWNINWNFLKRLKI